ncbi:MAG: hypothetical protein AAF754_01565 [Pseudomonadota bacterium]
MYHSAPILSVADELAAQIKDASTEERLRLQPQFGRVLQEMEQAGTLVPARLRNLHEQLLEETIEARFDNLPI